MSSSRTVFSRLDSEDNNSDVVEDKPKTKPKYDVMVVEAIVMLKERKGSSRIAILKYLKEIYNLEVNDNSVNKQVKNSLKRCVESGFIIQTKGIGATGSFKVGKEPKLEKKISKSTSKTSLTKQKLLSSASLNIQSDENNKEKKSKQKTTKENITKESKKKDSKTKEIINQDKSKKPTKKEKEEYKKNDSKTKEIINQDTSKKPTKKGKNVNNLKEETMKIKKSKKATK